VDQIDFRRRHEAEHPRQHQREHKQGEPARANGDLDPGGANPSRPEPREAPVVFRPQHKRFNARLADSVRQPQERALRPPESCEAVDVKDPEGSAPGHSLGNDHVRQHRSLSAPSRADADPTLPSNSPAQGRPRSSILMWAIPRMPSMASRRARSRR